MTRLTVGPFNRVEGDLEVHLDIADGRVAEARVCSPLYRGFEQILHGREPLDALAIAPRICGICSVSQSMAAARALAAAAEVTPPPNGALAADLMLACESLADHVTHFYLFFLPDLARAVYAAEPWYGLAEPRFRALTGSAPRALLPARAELLHLLGLLAGKWPHTLALQPGGTTRPVQPQERLRLLAILAAFRGFLERHTFGDRLEAIAALDSAEALAAWAEARPADASDFRLFLHIAEAVGLDRLGRSPGLFISSGGHGTLFRSGKWCGVEAAAGSAVEPGPVAGQHGGLRAGALTPLHPEMIREDLSHSWMHGAALHPAHGVTVPDPERPGAYTWCKAPRLDGQVVEVGALARQLVDGQPLLRDLAARTGGSVRERVIARLVECARLLPAMEAWVRRLRPGEPFCHRHRLPEDAAGFGLVEAARGTLGHWVTIRHGRVLSYQIVAPTTWNFSPRDAAGRPGALEQALVGAPVRPGETTPIAVQHIVRSFDPCMVCTVH